jgi:antitoxin component of MazEF toxin-antitoxin module
MGFKTKVQLIRRRHSQQFYINFPSACAQMMDLRKGEVVEWVLTKDGDLLLRRSRQRAQAAGADEQTAEK